MRRVPRQRRSREKVPHIRAVAGTLMAEVGYEAFIDDPTQLLERASAHTPACIIAVEMTDHPSRYAYRIGDVATGCHTFAGCLVQGT